MVAARDAVSEPAAAGRLESMKRERVKVDSGSLIYVDRNVYSVHSRLIGEKVEARLGAEIVEVWYAGRKVEDLARLRGRGKHRVDYRHIIDWLVRPFLAQPDQTALLGQRDHALLGFLYNTGLISDAGITLFGKGKPVAGLLTIADPAKLPLRFARVGTDPVRVMACLEIRLRNRRK
jgi:hypothetical protein